MLADFSIAPMDGGGKNLGRHVAKIVSLVKRSGLKYRLHSMGTLVEGERTKVFDLIRNCHTQMLKYSSRVYTVIKIDDRKGSTGRLEGKVRSVERYLK